MQLRFSWGRRLSGTAHNGGRASAGPEIEDPGIHAVRVPGADRIEVPRVKPREMETSSAEPSRQPAEDPMDGGDRWTLYSRDFVDEADVKKDAAEAAPK